MSGVVELGVYEKALQWRGSYEAYFAQAVDAGFSFMDLSVDETPEREARLRWPQEKRDEVRAASKRTGVELAGLCLSIHRRLAPGSSDAEVRQRAKQVLTEGIDLCVDLGIPVLQLAGYFAYYEDPHPSNREWYLECLRDGVSYAARRGVLLGIENVDGTDITSLTRAMEVIEEIDSPWLQLYPDIGNISEQGLPITAELQRGEGHMLAIHVKDVRRGEPRRVPMGQGIVDWDEAFATLAEQKWSGRIMIEMWNDEADDSVELAKTARSFIAERLVTHGFTVVEGPGAVSRQRGAALDDGFDQNQNSRGSAAAS